MKVSSFAVVAFALMLTLVGFVAGWTLGYMQPPPAQEVAGDVARVSSTTAEPTMPVEDVSGDDISRMPRYPGSVRIEYTREDLGGLTATEVEYLTSTDLGTVREFYRDAFRTEDWNVADVSFSEGAWTFFVTQDQREVFVEIKPHGGLTEVDFELTEPEPRKDPQKTPESEGEGEPSGGGGRTPEPGPQPPASAPASSASPAAGSAAPGSVAPSPASDDGFEGYDDDD